MLKRNSDERHEQSKKRQSKRRWSLKRLRKLEGKRFFEQLRKPETLRQLIQWGMTIFNILKIFFSILNWFDDNWRK